MNSRYNRYYTFIKPILRNTKIQTYSTLVFSLIAILFFTIFAIKPTVSTILSLQKAITQQQLILDTLNNKVRNLAIGRKNLDSIPPSTIDNLNNLLPDKTDIVSISENIASLATRNQASISGIQFQPTDLVGDGINLNKNALVKEVQFSFNSSGSYNTLVQFLDSLKTSSRILSIDSVILNQSQNGNLTMTVSGKSLYLQN